MIAQQALYKVNSIHSLAYSTQKFNGESERRKKEEKQKCRPNEIWGEGACFAGVLANAVCAMAAPTT